MCRAAPSIGKGPSRQMQISQFYFRFQGIADMDGAVAGPFRSRMTPIIHPHGLSAAQTTRAQLRTQAILSGRRLKR
jgi:hypothetical protein